MKLVKIRVFWTKLVQKKILVLYFGRFENASHAFLYPFKTAFWIPVCYSVEPEINKLIHFMSINNLDSARDTCGVSYHCCIE